MAACHGAVLCLSLWWYPMKPGVDALDLQHSVYRGRFKAAVYGALESGFRDGRQVVIVGSSDALLGFRPDELQGLMPGVRVHNIATASMRADEIRHMVKLVWDVMPVAQRARTTFVATLIFASFPSPTSLYARREAGVAQEIRQSGLFRETAGRFVPRWTGLPLRAAILARRPLAFAEACSDELSTLTFGVQRFFSEAFRRHTVDPTLLAAQRPIDALLFPRADTEAGRAINLDFFRGVMGGTDSGLDQAQFDEISRLCRWAGSNRADLVLVGMPVPGWVRSGLPFFAEYRDHLQGTLRDVAAGGSVRFVDLADADLPMWDSTHPEPGRTRAWAEALVAALGVRDPVDRDPGHASP